MSPVRFEPIISAGKRPQTYALDRHGDRQSMGGRLVKQTVHKALHTCVSNQFNSPLSPYRYYSILPQGKKVDIHVPVHAINPYRTNVENRVSSQ